MGLLSSLKDATLGGFDAIFGTDLSGKQEEADKKNREWQTSINQQNIAYQRESRELEYQRAKEFAQKGVQWKARDATQAGLHPLFAMGAGTSNYSPQFIGGQHETGSFRKAGIRSLNLVNLAQLKAINAQASRDEAAAALDLSRAARLDDVSNVSQDNDFNTGTLPPGTIKGVPSEVTSHAPGDPATAAGDKPFFEKRVVRVGKDGTPYYLSVPASDEPADSLENIGGVIMALAKNTGHGIDYWKKWAMQAYRLTAKQVNQALSKGRKLHKRQTRKARRRMQ